MSTSAATGGPFTAQMTRADAEPLALRDGDTVYVRATRVPAIGSELTAPGDYAGGADNDQSTLTSA